MPGADGWLVAIGGHALAPGPSWWTAVRRALEPAAELAGRGGPLVVTHGNGPQVGHALIRAQAAGDAAYPLALDACVAQTQGEMGYLIATVLEDLLRAGGVDRPVVTVLTRVQVDMETADLEPVKPIGPWLPGPPEGGTPCTHDPERGYRRLVPSPRPVAVMEIEAIRRIAERGTIVVAGGGGGIPVRADDPAAGIEAVVDKDHTSTLIATALGLAGWLNITDVPGAELHHGSGGAQLLGELTPAEARSHIAAGHFEAGSMRPKVEAALEFCEAGGRLAIITDPAGAPAALDDRAGTRIRSSP